MKVKVKCGRQGFVVIKFIINFLLTGTFSYKFRYLMQIQLCSLTFYLFIIIRSLQDSLCMVYFIIKHYVKLYFNVLYSLLPFMKINITILLKKLRLIIT